MDGGGDGEERDKRGRRLKEELSGGRRREILCMSTLMQSNSTEKGWGHISEENGNERTGTSWKVNPPELTES